MCQNFGCHFLGQSLLLGTTVLSDNVCICTYVCMFVCNFCIGTFILQNCTITSPSNGTVLVSCDSHYQIHVILTCNDCNVTMKTANGSSPINVTGLDPGKLYSVIIREYSDHVVLSNQAIMQTITVMNATSKFYYDHTCKH